MTQIRFIRNIMLAGAALLLPATASAQQPLFDDLTDAYFSAFDLNEAADYLHAHGAMLNVSRRADSLLQARGKNVTDISDGEFRGFYWNVKKSVAEIAYMLGLHAEMRQVSTQLADCLQRRTTNDADRNGFLADIAKINGGMYYLTEQYDSAETALKQALELKPTDQPFVQAVRGDLAQLYYSQEKYEETLQQLDAILAMVNRDAANEAKRMEVSSQRAICLARMGRYDDALTIINNVVDSYRQQADQRHLAEALRKKGKIMMLQYDATGRYNAEAATCYEEYLRIARAFVDQNFCGMSESEREQYWMAEHSFVTDCYRLEDKAPALLYDVALFSKSVLLQLGRTFQPNMTAQQRAEALSSVRVTWQQVQQGLAADAAAVEFINYEKGGKSHLGALVLTNTAAPQFVNIASLEDITNHVVSLNSSNQIKVKTLFTLRGGAGGDDQKISAIYNDSVLHTIVWPDALVQAIGNSSTIYMATDGIFHRLAPEYLLPAQLENKAIYRLTSTRQLTSARSAIRTDHMLMCGGVDYRQAQGQAANGNDELAYSLIAPMLHDLAYLPGSRAEIDSIRTLRSSHNGDLVLHADSVTETSMRQLLNQYHAVLISTHGYFAQATQLGTDLQPASADMQLSQSVIFLSGAETNIQDNNFDASLSDGILSAREVAALDLSNVDLTVISACQSGLGYITPDGVFGLQRGLKTAGVRAIITSLWEVSDRATSMLMRYLYANLEAGMPLHQAFSEARTKLHDEPLVERFGNFERKQFFSAPYFCDAFILIDALE